MEQTTVEIYSKSFKNTLNIFLHNYFSIPKLSLDIHPGQFLFGTHHTKGSFPNRTNKIGEVILCEKCLKNLLEKSQNLINAWYYPIINCETLTRGLVYENPISYQTILVTLIFTSFILAISNISMIFVTIFFIIILIYLNNSRKMFGNSKCRHL